VYRGGGYLAVRHGVGLVLSAGGVILLTRLLGPAEYGLYAAAASLFAVVGVLSQWGVGTYLVRHEGADDPLRYHHATAFLLAAGGLTVLAAAALLPWVEAWTRLDRLALPALALFAAVPVQLVAAVPMARLERALDFRAVAGLELVGQAGFFLTAVPLAAAGGGVWAPVAGVWLQQSVQAAAACRLAGYAPRPVWSGEASRAMARFGFSYSVSIWLWQARRLANPLVVGRWLGAEAVAYVAVAAQIATQLGFVAVAAWRISTAALARLQHDAARTASAVGEGMHLQALAVAPPVVAFAWLGGWLVPLVFGAAWGPLMSVYPAIALGLLTSSMFGMHAAALYVRRRNWDVAASHLAHLALLGGTAALLVPRVGLVGYAWAEVAALASFAVVHAYLARVVGRIPYGDAAPVWLAAAAALALADRPVVGVALAALVALLPGTRKVARGVWAEMKRRPHGA
jgi:PST family polysaccharide transporter